jgi:drug/metabolite transporter (DMT)-like permease
MDRLGTVEVEHGLIAEVGPVQATVVTYLNPAVAVVLGVVVLREPVTTGTVAGFALILAGSFLATRPAGGGRQPRPAPSGSRL